MSRELLVRPFAGITEGSGGRQIPIKHRQVSDKNPMLGTPHRYCLKPGEPKGTKMRTGCRSAGGVAIDFDNGGARTTAGRNWQAEYAAQPPVSWTQCG